MAGRTHGQPGARRSPSGSRPRPGPTRSRRHLDRLREGAPRWLVGQLGGGGRRARLLRPEAVRRCARRFCAELGPGRPRHLLADRPRPDRRVRRRAGDGLRHAGPDRQRGLRAAAARDRRAARAGRPRAWSAASRCRTSATPRRSEHLDTLARLVRATPAVLLEGMVGGHERDGRGWKAEWVALPEVCLLTGGRPARWPSACSPAWRSTPTAMRAQPRPTRYTGSRAGAGRADRAGSASTRAQALLHDGARRRATAGGRASTRRCWRAPAAGPRTRAAPALSRRRRRLGRRRWSTTSSRAPRGRSRLVSRPAAGPAGRPADAALRAAAAGGARSGCRPAAASSATT